MKTAWKKRKRDGNRKLKIHLLSSPERESPSSARKHCKNKNTKHKTNKQKLLKIRALTTRKSLRMCVIQSNGLGKA